MEHLRKLPSDLPPVIWNYLSIYDVFRFGITAKNILKITWPWYEKLYIPFNFPMDRLKSVLERDLNRIRTLEFSYGQLPDEQAPFLIQQIEGLKYGTLPNLHSLIVRFYCLEKIIVNVSAAMRDLVTRMTQLHLIALHDIGERNDSINIGQLLVNHTRLTSLAIFTCPRALQGVSLLTSLKNLGLSEIPDDTLIEAAALTRLTSLDIDSYDKPIAHQAIVEITRLVNLEKLSMTRTYTGNLNILFRLEKLSWLAVNYPNDLNREAIIEDFELFGQLTNLTQLFIDGFGMPSVSSLTKLTNLLDLTLRVSSTVADFRPFTRLTALEFFSSTLFAAETSVIGYPPNLKRLRVEFSTKQNDVEMICRLKLLQSLSLDPAVFDWNAWAEDITQLNQLQTLSLSSAPTSGMLQALQQLPNLAVLKCNDIRPETIEGLAKLTQLMTLSVKFGEKDLRAKVPFHVERSFIL